LRREHLKTALAHLRHAQPQRPQRVTMAIFRADFLNRNDSSKFSDRSAFKSAMTGVAGFSGSHLERLNASPARQQS
jgi:hypothetical protein